VLASLPPQPPSVPPSDLPPSDPEILPELEPLLDPPCDPELLPELDPPEEPELLPDDPPLPDEAPSSPVSAPESENDPLFEPPFPPAVEHAAAIAIAADANKKPRVVPLVRVRPRFTERILTRELQTVASAEWRRSTLTTPKPEPHPFQRRPARAGSRVPRPDVDPRSCAESS
jgi:hypothetical protein